MIFEFIDGLTGPQFYWLGVLCTFVIAACWNAWTWWTTEVNITLGDLMLILVFCLLSWVGTILTIGISLLVICFSDTDRIIIRARKNRR